MPENMETPTFTGTISFLRSVSIPLLRRVTCPTSHLTCLQVGQKPMTEKQRHGEVSAFSRSSERLTICGEQTRLSAKCPHILRPFERCGVFHQLLEALRCSELCPALLFPQLYALCHLGIKPLLA